MVNLRINAQTWVEQNFSLTERLSAMDLHIFPLDLSDFHSLQELLVEGQVTKHLNLGNNIVFYTKRII